MRNPFHNKWSKEDDREENDSSGRFIHFAKRVMDYFNTEPQKERVLSQEDFNAAGDVYYASVSAYYKVAQRLLVLFLVFFLVFSMITNLKEITYDNFYYLVKDFTSAADFGKNNYETLSYESDSRQKFVLYRGGIATVSPSKISIFTATGRRTLNESSDFSSPFAVSSDKYVLFYDTAGRSFSIYNSFARVYTEELENPVKCAALSNNGSFAVVTKSSQLSWSVRVYNENFKLKAIIPCNAYVFGVSFDNDSEKMSIISYDSGEGIGRTIVSVYDISRLTDSKENEINLMKKLVYAGEFPIKCGFTSKNSLSIITDRFVRTLDKDFDEKEKSEDSTGNITGYFLSGEGAAVSVMNESGTLIYVYDPGGNLICDRKFSYNVSDLAVFGRYAFVQTEQGVVRIDTRDNTEKALECGNGKMLIYNEKTVLICGESKAEYLVFN